VVIDRDLAVNYLLPKLYEIFCKTGLMSPEKGIPMKKDKINYAELAASYRELINSGVCKNQAELSRYLGVSRAWVTRIMTYK